jgi:hypothetical protein
MAFGRAISAGVQQTQFLFYDANGEPSGDTPTALANGEYKGAYQAVGIQELPTGLPEAEAVTIPGDDSTLGSILFAADAPREMLINFGEMDLDWEALLQNTLVETLGDIKMGLLDTANTILASGALIVQARSVKRSSGVSGQAGWSGLIYPNVQIQPLGRETFSGRTAGVFRYKAVAQQAFYKPWGVTISDEVNGDSAAYAIPFTSPYPLTMGAFRGDGITTSWTLHKTPINVNKTRPFSDRVALTVNSVTPSTKVMVLSAAVAAGRPASVVLEYQ